MLLSFSRTKGFGIWLILLIALTVRIWGTNFGLPYFFFHTDENRYIHYILSILAPDEYHLRARLDFPSFFYYVLALVSGVYYSLGRIFASFHSVKDISLSTLYLLLRMTTAVFSTAVVYLTYRIGKKLYNRTVGLIAGLILSFTFLDVLTSHYIKHDVYAQFFGILAFLFCCLVYRTGKLKHYLLSGLFIGIAIAIKLTAFFFIVPLITAHLLFAADEFWDSRKIRVFFDRNIFYGLLAILFGLGISNPHYLMRLVTSKLLFNVSTSLTSTHQILASNADGIATGWWWLVYLAASGLFYPFFILSMAGIIHGIKKHTKTEILLFSFPVVYYLILSVRPVSFDRWAVNLTPFLAIFAALFLYESYCFLRYRLNLKNSLKATLILLLFIFTVGVSAVRVCLFDYSIAHSDTREQAAKWLTKNLPKENLFFAIGGTIHIGQYLQKMGYRNVLNLFPFDNKEIFHYPGEVLAVSSGDYHVAHNYQTASEEYKNFYKNYLLFIQKGKLLKEFSDPLFKFKLFSPAFLEHSSTVNTYHNPTIQIFAVPEVKPYAYSPIEVIYSAQDLKEFSGLELVSDSDSSSGKALQGKTGKGGTVGGPHPLFSAGEHLVNFFLKVGEDRMNQEVVIIDVTTSGTGRLFAKRSINGADFKKLNIYQKFTIPLKLTKGSRMEFRVHYPGKTNLWIEKIEVKRR